MSLNKLLGFTIFILIISCKGDDLILDYCEMLDEDQSHVNHDRSDMVKYISDQNLRLSVFKKNFEMIMQKVDESGFPNSSNITTQDESTNGCIDDAVKMIMIHTAQSNPELFFSSKNAKIFKREMDKGNLSRKTIILATNLAVNTIDMCDYLKPRMDYAMKLWGLTGAIYTDNNFIKCN